MQQAAQLGQKLACRAIMLVCDGILLPADEPG
jgi:hypothetical protein